MSATFCFICASTHSDIGISCKNPICMAPCFGTCLHVAECQWPAPPQPLPVEVPQAQQPQITIDSSLQEAFESWLASTEFVKTTSEPGILWTEFESFARERLVQVDQNKNYLQVVTKGDKMSLLDLDKERLFRNQDGKYVLMDGKRRLKIAKVAVLEG